MRSEGLKASLVVGGSGMLAHATRWLAFQSSVTVLVARRATRFADGDPVFLPVDTDWSSTSFRDDLARATQAVPTIERALLWLHDPASILPKLLPLLEDARIVLLLGSMDGQPEIAAVAERIATVRLGSKRISNARRWLTHEEISAGAIEALRDGRSRIVGELGPI